MKGALDGRQDYSIRISERKKGIFCVDRIFSFSFFGSPVVVKNFSFPYQFLQF